MRFTLKWKISNGRSLYESQIRLQKHCVNYSLMRTEIATVTSNQSARQCVDFAFICEACT